MHRNAITPSSPVSKRNKIRTFHKRLQDTTCSEPLLASFNPGMHTANLEIRARKRLNLIKIFSHKSWKLSHQTLKGIYNALIGSLFVYSFFSVARIVVTNLRLQRVQNREIRSICRLEWTSSTDLIHSISILFQ